MFYPVHCAALGGNLDLLKWLVEDNCCPIKSVRVSGKSREAQSSFTEISTSKGRSLLGIALENRNISIVRYLVCEKNINLQSENVSAETLSQNLDLVLRMLPEEATQHSHLTNTPPPPNDESNISADTPIACIDKESQEVKMNATSLDELEKDVSFTSCHNDF